MAPLPQIAFMKFAIGSSTDCSDFDSQNPTVTAQAADTVGDIEFATLGMSADDAIAVVHCHCVNTEG